MELANGRETNLVTANGCASNNSTKATPALCADIISDWREEVLWRTLTSKELRVYITTIPSDHRLYTLMRDPSYRLSVAYQNVGNNQATQPGIYLGDGMAPPRRHAITTGVAHRPLGAGPEE
jgi:rhamnogalacturonan endolyase